MKQQKHTHTPSLLPWQGALWRYPKWSKGEHGWGELHCGDILTKHLSLCQQVGTLWLKGNLHLHYCWLANLSSNVGEIIYGLPLKVT